MGTFSPMMAALGGDERGAERAHDVRLERPGHAAFGDKLQLGG